MAKNYYMVLGVSRGADLKRIKKAYRTVAKKYHPDKVQPGENAKRFLEIKEAYETLSNDTKRRKHDEELERQGSQLKVTNVADVIKKRTFIWDKLDRFYSPADDFFEGFLPGFFDRGKNRIRNKDLYYEVVLSPREAAEGGLYPITVPVIEPCPRCGKSGSWEGFFCPVCSGYGRVQTEREFSLSIPPHVRDGTQIRLSLEDIGLRDSYLNISVHIDPFLEEEAW